MQFWAFWWSSEVEIHRLAVGGCGIWHCTAEACCKNPSDKKKISAHFLCQCRWGRTHKYTLWFTLTHTIICIRSWIYQTAIAHVQPFCSYGIYIRIFRPWINKNILFQSMPSSSFWVSLPSRTLIKSLSDFDRWGFSSRAGCLLLILGSEARLHSWCKVSWGLIHCFCLCTAPYEALDRKRENRYQRLPSELHLHLPITL